MIYKATNILAQGECQNGHYKNVHFGINSVFMGRLMSLKPPQTAINHNISSTFITYFSCHTPKNVFLIKGVKIWNGSFCTLLFCRRGNDKVQTVNLHLSRKMFLLGKQTFVTIKSKTVLQSLAQNWLGSLAHLLLLNSVHCKSRIWPFSTCAAKSMTVIKGILIKPSIKTTFFFQTIYNQ